MPMLGSGATIGSELWCSKALHEESDSGLCRLPWHVVSLTLLLIACGVACAAAAAIVVGVHQRKLNGARVRRTLYVFGGVGLLSFGSVLAMAQHAWVGTDVWPAGVYLSFVKWAIWSGWYQFGLSTVPEPTGQKVYIDVGARYYNTSCRWFKEHYPQVCHCLNLYPNIPLMYP